MPDTATGPTPSTPAEKVKTFPPTPGVYLMKDTAGTVIYVGKARNLRSRAGSYFLKEAALDSRTRDWVGKIADLDFISTPTEVDALLYEARLVKDLRPASSTKTCGTTRRSRTCKSAPGRSSRGSRLPASRGGRGVKLFGPFTSANGSLKVAVNVLQRIFKFRNCSLDIKSGDDRWRWFRPCLLHSIRQCTAPCNFRVSREDYRRQIKKLIFVLEGKKGQADPPHVPGDGGGQRLPSTSRKRPGCGTRSSRSKKLELRGDVKKDVQPEVFPLDPKKGLKGLQKVLGLGPHATHN